MTFNVEWQRSGEDVRLKFSGVLDEEACLPEIKEPVTGVLEVDLEDLTMINSLGCRRWAEWIRKHAFARGGVRLLRCSPAVVNQMNVLHGFLPAHVRVDSFFLPYLCDDCGSEDRLLLTRGHEFDDQGAIRCSDVLPCRNCRAEMELEVVKDRYFQFLKPAV